MEARRLRSTRSTGNLPHNIVTDSNGCYHGAAVRAPRAPRAPRSPEFTSIEKQRIGLVSGPGSEH